MKKSIYLIGTILLGAFSLALLAYLGFSIFGKANAARVFYTEPSLRPDINPDAVWDDSLGLYVLKEKELSEEELEQIMEQPYVPSAEEKWLEAHRNSDDPIDKAILLSLELLKDDSLAQPNPALSAIAPSDYEAITIAMKTIPITSLPELYRSICEEPAYRDQKLTAMEMLLNIELGWGLFDPYARGLWRADFAELKANIPSGAVTKAEVEKYGLLLLPNIVKRAESGLISDSELKCFTESLGSHNKAAVKSFDASAFSSADSVKAWAKNNKEIVSAIEKLIKAEYDWASGGGLMAGGPY